MENQLLMCPFCGGKAYFDSETICCGHGDYRTLVFISCSKCSAKSGSVYCSDLDKARMQVCELWNRRDRL